ncbi:MAG TPA: 4-(cytidine 5'-diphospho)-2-C-methyl-D-erythritol kinase, partial [Acidimicrobiales bacterium]|nr:4-(cytidine 5'-diphospho)-2-C-methyl-D-erythritol kinase [Acidimicrobiales bacterium]
LRWARLSPAEAALLASQLGSDVPFCLLGEGRARVAGAGELVEPLPWGEVAGMAFTLLVPPFGVPTGAVYETWDELGGPQGANFNDLEDAALRAEPRLVKWRDRLGEETGQSPRLAGSGSTWFVEGPFPGGARKVVRAWRL